MIDLTKARDIKQELFAVTDSIAEYYESEAIKMFPDTVSEIERLRNDLIEERARGEFYFDMIMSLVHANRLKTDPWDLWRKDEYREPSYIDESDATRMARQQLESEGKI